MNSSQPAAKATSPRLALFWSFAERYLGLLISIASTMLLSRLLTPSQVGIYSMCAAFTAVAGILRDFGVSEYLIQEKELTREKVRSAYAVAFIVAWVIGAVAFLSRNLLADFYAEPRVAEVMLVLTLHFLILPISSPTFAMMNREMAFRLIFFMQLASNAMQAITSVTLAYLGFGVLSLAWGPIANVATQTLILIWLRPRDVLCVPGLSQVRQVLRFGWMYVASRALETVGRNFHDPVIARQFDFASVGLFSRAFGLVDLFYTNVSSAVLRVATPAFAAANRNGQPLAPAYARATAIFTSIAWTFFGFVGVMAVPIIELMFGSQWVQAGPIASMLAVAVLPSALFVLAPQMLAATGHVRERLKVTLLFTPVHLAVVVLMSHISLLVVASAWFVSQIVAFFLYLRVIKRILRATTGQLLRPCVSSAITATVSVLAQISTKWLLAPSGLGHLPVIAFVLASGAVGWLLAARALQLPAYDELMKLLTLWRNRRARQV